MYMYEFGFHFLQLYFSLPRVQGNVRIAPEQSGLNKKRQIYNKVN